ncbi:MAG TPA: PhzF family phenazine biosynthesis protein [Acidisarcina sp.]
MPNYNFQTVDVFTDRMFGGNPLAVFPEASGMTTEQMQSLAMEFNLSETTFVLAPVDPVHTARVRIFNKAGEMPFAGHPMVGTGFVLANLKLRGELMTFEVPAGVVKVHLKRDGRQIAGATIDAPEALTLGAEFAPEEIAATIGLTRGDVVTGSHPPLMASVGNPYIIAELRDAALDRAIPDARVFAEMVSNYPGLAGRFSLYVYAHKGQDLAARMFAPLSGTYEDAATGSAAAPLAGLLLSLSGRELDHYLIRQGEKMGRPSVLHASSYRDSEGIHASVGGSCVPVLRGEVTLL